ncbi:MULTISPECIES: AbiJ-NTD4 domain-containing protein [unclassified Bradyrhizobium]|uniref:AbiJ-NTD4 domain-containing protein n=1 Tax=unclassified Bradyrhizobium TaxID=2631580 RepID=UPI0033930656
MLTDIFARRYEQPCLWETFLEVHRRLLAQGFQLLSDVRSHDEEFWTRIHDLLARELGLKELYPRYWGLHTAQDPYHSGPYTAAQMCEKWMQQAFDGKQAADRFIKERLSLVEIGLRQHENFVAELNAKLADNIAAAELFDQRGQRKGLLVPGHTANRVRATNASLNAKIQNAVNELNVRFRQADFKLHYHNGFIQISEDQAVAQAIEMPFWKLVSGAKWRNVDHDMKEAIDLRDTGGRDPARYAAHALESTIKIISDEKQLTRGNEKGAANFIDNLRGAKLIEVWEMEALKHFFSRVRNPIGHGPGAAPMPGLTDHQTSWAIENCMIWIKSLIRRM